MSCLYKYQKPSYSIESVESFMARKGKIHTVSDNYGRPLRSQSKTVSKSVESNHSTAKEKSNLLELWGYYDKKSK